MKIRAFITHKKAEHFRDCQDRFCINSETKSVAVSDGMSQSWHQKIWAQMLVEKFCSNREWVPNLESVRELSPIWRSEVEKFIQNLKDSNAKENLIYRNEKNLAEGRSAGATLVGARFEGNRWSCDVLGDSCLITLANNRYEFITSQDTEKFDNHPDFYDSDSRKQGRGILKSYEGELSNSNPLIIMVSDPFSDFLLEHNKKGDIDSYIIKLSEISNHDEFECLVEDWRKLGMHNDDTTLIIMEYDEKEDWNILYQDNLEDLIKKEEVPIPTQVIEKLAEEKAENIVLSGQEEGGGHLNNKVPEDEFCDSFLKVALSKYRGQSIVKKIGLSIDKKKLINIQREVAKDIYSKYEIYNKG